MPITSTIQLPPGSDALTRIDLALCRADSNECSTRILIEPASLDQWQAANDVLRRWTPYEPAEPDARAYFAFAPTSGRPHSIPPHRPHALR